MHDIWTDRKIMQYCCGAKMKANMWCIASFMFMVLRGKWTRIWCFDLVIIIPYLDVHIDVIILNSASVHSYQIISIIPCIHSYFIYNLRRKLIGFMSIWKRSRLGELIVAAYLIISCLNTLSWRRWIYLMRCYSIRFQFTCWYQCQHKQDNFCWEF